MSTQQCIYSYVDKCGCCDGVAVDSRLLRCGALSLGECSSTFRRIVISVSSGFTNPDCPTAQRHVPEHIKFPYMFFFYVHGTVHLGNTSFIKYQRDATFSVYLVFITLHVSDAVCVHHQE